MIDMHFIDALYVTSCARLCRTLSSTRPCRQLPREAGGVEIFLEQAMGA